MLCSKCSEAINACLAMQSTLAYNASSQLVSSIKGTFIENPNARKVTQVSMEKSSGSMAKKPKDFHQLHPHTIPAQSLQYKIFLLHAGYKLRAPLICSHTMQNKAVVKHTVRDGIS